MYIKHHNVQLEMEKINDSAVAISGYSAVQLSLVLEVPHSACRLEAEFK